MTALRLFTILGLWLPGAFLQAADEDIAAQRKARLEDLGRTLFFDVNLSRDRTQSCATCHDPAVAFTDWRPWPATPAVDAADPGFAPAPGSIEAAHPAAASLGGDLTSLGDRNAPTASYAALVPAFQRDANGDYVGGLFWDGRAASLEEQAGGPPLNPVEMAQQDTASVVHRLQENPYYSREFPALFGTGVFSDVEAAYAGMTSAIAAFERTEFFSPFDSKYDRYLRGEYTPTEQETLGMTLFFSNQFTNCNQCHQLQAFPEAELEVFTNHRYENIGVPVNAALRARNGLGETHVDRGLLENPAVDDPAAAGRFRVPTLRNVALTGPYMHNGVFDDLRTVVLFYNKYLARGSKAQVNPETGETWGEPEVPENLALEKLQSGNALDERRIDALVAFMEMLTDKRYEPALEARKAARK